MTERTEKTQSQFSELKLKIVDALCRIYDSEIMARDERDAALAKHLYEKRRAVMARFLELRRAEIAFEKSDRTTEEQSVTLANSVARVQTGIENLQDLKQAKKGSDEVVDVLVNIVNELR